MGNPSVRCAVSAAERSGCAPTTSVLVEPLPPRTPMPTIASTSTSSPSLAPVAGGASVTRPLSKGASGPAVKKLQQALERAGFDVGMIDGSFGPGVKTAVEAFQRANDLPVTGIADAATQAKLAAAKPSPKPEKASGVGASAAEIAAAAKASIKGLTFEKLTPTGEKLMRAAHWWMDNQFGYPSFPRPRMCATNVSKVFSLVGLGKYREEGVRAMTGELKAKGAQVTRMPNNEAGFIKKLNEVFGGSIPAGTVISGNHVTKFDPGMQHIGFVGHTDSNGVVWIYHNNWLRPANAGGQRSEHMVSARNLASGMERQWMATPWIKVKKDASGKVVDVKSMLPKLDDMDPLNKEFFVNLAVPAEIAKELAPKQPDVKPDVTDPVVSGPSVSEPVPAGDGKPLSTQPSVVGPSEVELKAQALVTGRPV